MELIYHSLSSQKQNPETFIIIEYSIKKGHMTGQIFYLFTDFENNDRYNKNHYLIKDTFPHNTKESDEGILSIINGLMGVGADSSNNNFIKTILINEFKNGVLVDPFNGDDFVRMDIKEFRPYKFDNDTLDFFINKLNSETLTSRFIKAKNYPYDKNERGEQLS